MAHQPGIKGFHTSQATGIRGLSGLQNPSQLHKGFRLLEPTGIKEEEEEEANEHLDASDSSFLFKKFHGINFIANLITVSTATKRGVISLPYTRCSTHCVFDVQGLHISLLQSSKSISVDMEVKGESLFLGGRSVTYWFRLQ